MYDTEKAQGTGPGYASREVANQAGEPAPLSVAQRLDRIQEITIKLKNFSESFYCDVRQIPSPKEGALQCRTGMDGKLADTEDRLEEAFKALLETRNYLLGN